MKYSAFRLDYGKVTNNGFDRTCLVIDGQMDCPYDTRKHLNWKELASFGQDFESAWNVVINLLLDDELVYMPGGVGYRKKDLEKMIESYEHRKEFYYTEIVRGERM